MALRKVIALGAGPAGLYASLLLKKQRPDAEITVLERNPPDATYGFGVVFSERTLAALREADQPTHQAIVDEFVLWDAITVHHRGEAIRVGGQGFAGMSRRSLLDLLQRRCRELGVELRFEHEVGDVAALDDADLVLAADGVNSLLRLAHEDAFRPEIEWGATRYIWLGAPLVLDSFTFAFRENEHGLFRAHAYPYDAEMSTFIVECPEATWRRAGLDQASEDESVAYCEALFAPELRGASLVANRSLWLSFPTLRTAHWHRGNLVLLGDAAHTAHFSIGSGTKLAMEDAAALSGALERHGDLAAALAEYELERKPVVDRFQAAAADSRTYFEDIERYRDFDPIQFTFYLLTRSGRVDYDRLRLGDGGFVDRVDRWFAGADAGPFRLAAAPMHAPLKLRGLRLANRVAVAAASEGPASAEAASAGAASARRLASAGRDHSGGVAASRGASFADALASAAATGAGLVCTPTLAVAPDGRVTPEDPVLDDEHVEAWRAGIERASAPVLLCLDHAGPRGACRPRREGLDRPLRDPWPLVAASARPYVRGGPVPQALDEDGMARVQEQFVQAARRAHAAGAAILQLQLAHGHLLASFLSPLTNPHDDDRMRFPLQVVEAVRAAWPQDKPLAAAVPAADWAPGGLTLDDAVILARELVARGVDLIEPLSGQGSPAACPPYGRGFLTPAADRLRNEAGCATLVGGHLTRTAEVNTILAAGRADLCLLDLSRERFPAASDPAPSTSALLEVPA